MCQHRGIISVPFWNSDVKLSNSLSNQNKEVGRMRGNTYNASKTLYGILSDFREKAAMNVNNSGKLQLQTPAQYKRKCRQPKGTTEQRERLKRSRSRVGGDERRERKDGITKSGGQRGGRRGDEGRAGMHGQVGANQDWKH